MLPETICARTSRPVPTTAEPDSVPWLAEPVIFGRSQAGLRQTETWLWLSPVKGARSQSARRRSSVMSASCAMRSHSAGQMYRKLLVAGVEGLNAR